ncbi:ATP-binding protein [Bradyrhizobium sp. SYSU BS000235]|uniref:ATP-binding protein n=1 Tax=Bradyrhizobium sp. SYSU BS000235 TaxID=3411332 RepID=UPI003C7830DC
MWTNASLRFRLNLLIAFVLITGLIINIGRVALEAGPRVAAEDQSVTRLAKGLIEAFISDLGEASNPELKLEEIARDLRRLRHVAISHVSDGGNRDLTDLPSDTHDDINEPPAWFVRFVHPTQTKVIMPINVGGRSFGSLMIKSDPRDEIAEIWQGIVTQLIVGTVVTIALLLITMLVVDRSLGPVNELAQAMGKIGAGEYGIRVKPGGSPEIAAMCTELNHLAAALKRADDDKRNLAARVVSLQDTERKDIAAELHDEFGPHLFALRAHASSLANLARNDEPDLSAVRAAGQAIHQQINALQQSNRNVLARLRPVGLAELGLRTALEALFRRWREIEPQVEVATTVSPEIGGGDETTDLTIYRIVQEALTNAFRHSKATRINVVIDSDHDRRAIQIRVEDNGVGLSSDDANGFGLTGMRERAMALGGRLMVASTNKGVSVEATVPLPA